ncbi:GNAT family N-acetyltransferase [Chryseolinea lacunae]|uniref:GNAT family N-acetyltransferase n=1 Tax=Chryseolinea lacunae TaxID=2801331 RepID=A0ABS1KRF0_9BACT|nr:GNAT family N-acetyltransferase [Chryseolinea lacunae]MBL0741905.1 GNAT family N-acetyltransferase [Chryseolinea lacunae]
MITIQKATLQDVDTLIDFQQKLAFESEGVTLNGNVLRKGLHALFADPNKGFYFIAKENSEVIGCHMITFEWSDWRNGMVWWLQSVYVKESHRKKGVFKLMYDNIVNIVNADPGLIGLRLYVDKTNARAMKVYEAMGMDGSHYTVYEWMKA